ncbi:YihY family inner membrane protein [Thalassococcus profundi]|uniref:UPF0761 membrane protein DU478_07930 n=1 Tax=Thalassococcus profundi TaxID=2282382 RepID=A0A369TV87_9RHOB|nr:YihY family inner membrane protein [Thalassococcus profundi]RDD66866.1 YihY family inner membrane protein [Thalassococcus profundi]
MKQFLTRIDTLRQTRAGSAIEQLGHFVVFALRRFFNERMNNSAASLTYSTLLALVPLLVIAFAILSSFPAFNEVKGRMQELFFSAVVPEAGAAISDYLTNFTQNASNLTAVGIVALAVAALLLLSTVEDTLNRVWHVDRPRPILVRLLIFWAILTLGPLLIAASITLTSDLRAIASSSNLQMLGVEADTDFTKTALATFFLSVLINIVGFTALFVLVPARRVRIRHAIIGATFAAISFEVLSWGFNTFYSSGSSYETIYGAVAAVPVFLVWIYTSWMVIILGAVFAASFPDWWESRSAVLGADLSASGKLQVAVAVLARLMTHARTGRTIDVEDLVDAAPLEARDEIVEQLTTAGYLVETENGCIALSRDLYVTTLHDLARDLGLSLGLDPASEEAVPEALRARLGPETEAVRDRLERLFDAESGILDAPLAELLKARDDGAMDRAAE